jgi:hypothetical protein
MHEDEPRDGPTETISPYDSSTCLPSPMDAFLLVSSNGLADEK